VYRLKYLPSFDIDFAIAEDYLYEHSPPACDKFTRAVTEKMATLPENPFIYPVYHLDDRFRLMVLSYQYLCFYRVDEDAGMIAVHRLIRSMRDIPNLL
jgi:hypothetical protein